MQERLIIFLHSHDLQHPSWVLCEDETFKKVVYLGEPTELTNIASNKEIILIVPAEDVLLTSTQLPKMSRSKLIQALPFALEEQLIDDIDTLHFAPIDKKNDDNLPVAVVSKEKMQMWLSQCQEWKITVDMLIPLTLALPVTENAWHVFIHETAVVRTNTYFGFACEIPNLSQLITLTLANNTEIPEIIYLHNFTGKSITRNLNIAIDVKEEMHKAEKMLTIAAATLENYPPINLLQGSFRNKNSKFTQTKQLLKILTYLGIAALVLLIAYPTVSYIILKPRLSELSTGIKEIYQRNFPNSKTMVAPQMRLEEKLQALGGNTTQNKFLFILGYIGKAKNHTPSIQFKRMDYVNNQLTLELIAPSSEDFSKFTDYLISQKLNVKQQNATISGTKVNATVVID